MKIHTLETLTLNIIQRDEYHNFYDIINNLDFEFAMEWLINEPPGTYLPIHKKIKKLDIELYSFVDSKGTLQMALN